MKNKHIDQKLSLIWFRQDLRLGDNLALRAASDGGHVLAVYIFDDVHCGDFAMGGASLWWLNHSLKALNESLSHRLNIYRGDAQQILLQLCQRHTVDSVYWNRCYEPWAIARDTAIKKALVANNIEVKSFNSALINEPWSVLKKDRSSYKVFTPYYRQASAQELQAPPLAKPELSSKLTKDACAISIASLCLLPSTGWDRQFYHHWRPGEAGAQQALHHFLDNGLSCYKSGRDFPAQNAISKLSPHLHFGEISVRQINQELLSYPCDAQQEHFKRELYWREFAYHLIYHQPQLATKNLKANFDCFPWQTDAHKLSLWQNGTTGYPMVDAGMRELWQTGYMHNRVRMITASFLVKNLLIDWRLGACWFWDCLLDADLANNSAGWQWVAGCGTDAAPYFRIFNPVSQGEKFDPDGHYIKHYLPELEKLPVEYLHAPWQAPQPILDAADITLGKTYPMPIVGIKSSREAALAAYASTLLSAP